MKLSCYFLLTIILIIGAVEGRSRSFFMPRQVSADPVFEYGMTQYQIYCTEDCQDYPSKL